MTDILLKAEASAKEGMTNAIGLLSEINRAVQCLSQVFRNQYPLTDDPICRELLDAASQAVREFKVESNIAYKPFEFFWENPSEPQHSLLLKYFIDPRSGHNCWPYLLPTFLRTLDIIDGKFVADDKCEVTREDEYIDLLITRKSDKDSSRKYAVIVENKVNNALDRPKQLQTYYEVLRRRDFSEDEIFLCYLPLRARKPSADSLGTLKEDRVKMRTFQNHILTWLESALCENNGMPEGMRDNLRHYRDLIKWLLNNEKTMEMNERIFKELQNADKNKQLPEPGEIEVLKQSVLALEACYNRLLRAKTLSSVWQILQDRYGLTASHTYHDGWTPSPIWYDDLKSEEYFFGFCLDGIVIVAIGEDGKTPYVGYCVPESEVKGQRQKQFREFVKKSSSIFSGESNDYWYSYKYMKDTIRQDDDLHLAEQLFNMYREMEGLVAAFKRGLKKRN